MKNRKVEVTLIDGTTTTNTSVDNPFEISCEQALTSNPISNVTFYLSDVEVGSVYIRPLIEKN